MAAQGQAPQPIANPGAAAAVIPPGTDEFQVVAAAVKAGVNARQAEYREIERTQPWRARRRDKRLMKRVEFLQNEIARLRNKCIKANAAHQIVMQQLRIEIEAAARRAQNPPRN
ncbi:hypothetical protein BV898_11231 [Hypsibius exemplaris]|uniref:Uncharacterized protein n=1 Tax=Hypsibius exemplaris TaxID=2072580 RepID=A0A1W0WHF1_HYPEX|nr:hypothetical protein BV898_11231 [Hypsibius exemplaris]